MLCKVLLNRQEFPLPVATYGHSNSDERAHGSERLSNGQREVIAVEELARFQHYLHFVSLDPAENRARFYLLSWQASLLGDTALVCR